jgi:drug/metabolite transporter (DMT)-like permease
MILSVIIIVIGAIIIVMSVLLEVTTIREGFSPQSQFFYNIGLLVVGAAIFVVGLVLNPNIDCSHKNWITGIFGTFFGLFIRGIAQFFSGERGA